MACLPRRGRPEGAVIATVLLLGAASVSGQGKAPVPDDAAQTKAKELVREVYAKQYQAVKTPSEQLALAEKLLEQAAKTKTGTADHFVLLRIAQDVAALAANAEAALKAVRRIVDTYEVDAIRMKVDCLRAVGAAAKSSSQHGALARQAFSLVDEAVAEDRFEAAAQLAEIAEESARRARNYTLLKQIVARMKKLEELERTHGEFQKAMARLEEQPADPEANLVAARYLCL